MNDAGYITDVEYTGGFYGHLAPLWLNYIAALNGVRPRPTEGEFTHCELGCGKGETAAVLADMHPGARFYAADMNANHIRFAQGLAQAGKLGNVAFIQKTFAEMLLMDLPQFDFIVLHGVWSWVPESARSELRALIKHRLKPGGLVMVSYNAMPGWAYILPLREMMHAYVSSLEGDSIARARQALGYLKFLSDNKAAYFVNNPGAAEHVAFLLQQDVRYVAHEYITQYGVPFYFSQVQRAMAEIGLSYAGSMMPELNYSELTVPEAFRNFLKTAPSQPVLETHRDFIVNTRFRNDLYAAQQGPRTRTMEDPTLFCATRFALMQVPEQVELKGSTGAVNFDLTAEEKRARAVFARLAEGPATIEELHAATGEGKTMAETIAFVMQLVVVRRITPVSRHQSPPRGWSPLNRALLENALREREKAVFLGCPAVGTGAQFAVTYALSIELANDCASAAEAGERGAALLGAHQHRMLLKDAKGNQREASAEDTRKYFGAAWEKLRDSATPEARYLRLLGFAPGP